MYLSPTGCQPLNPQNPHTMTLDVYLNFPDGRCEEALKFYAEILGGDIVSMQRFGEGPMEVPEGAQNHVMHAEFKAGEVFFLASDTMPGQPIVRGNNMSLTISMDNEAEQKKAFDALAEGGTVTMPLEKTFWGAYFGMLTDKFGINWMLSSAA